jgi:hypothetical protein
MTTGNWRASEAKKPGLLECYSRDWWTCTTQFSVGTIADSLFDIARQSARFDQENRRRRTRLVFTLDLKD